MTATGKGIGRARVSLTDWSGETRTTLSNPFGYYSFEAVAAGGTYIITVESRRYTFENPSQILNVSEDVAELNFTANE